MKLKSADGTEINARGPVITEEALEQLMQKLDMLEKGDVLVLAGSIPTGLPATIYQDILHRLSGKEILTVVDGHHAGRQKGRKGEAHRSAGRHL